MSGLCFALQALPAVLAKKEDAIGSEDFGLYPVKAVVWMLFTFKKSFVVKNIFNLPY